MNLSFFIASRYFRSKKKRNFINILSRIAMVGVAVGTMALVIVLSVFNGLEDLIRGLYASFDAELKIEPVRGKSFEVDDQWLGQIREVEGVQTLTEVIEDNALLRYRKDQMVVTLKGVTDNFLDEERFNKGYFIGDLTLGTQNQPAAIIGRGVGYFLGIDLDNEFEKLRVYYPKAPRAGTIDPRQMYNSDIIRPASFFSVEKKFDDEYIIVPMAFARDLLNYQNKRTSLEINVADNYRIGQVKEKLKALLGEDFSVKDADEQHAGLLRAIKIEKLFVFITLTFILAVASFNIFFSLSMLAIEKKKDIAVLLAMGATNRLIRSIFIKQGAIIAFSGAIIGLLLGFVFCWLQDTYGLISLGVASSVVENYPVKIIWTDFLWTSISVVVITFLAAYRPAAIAAKVKTVEHL
ncbi:FtsX-like permease family protein [Echinicola jeungdonensis]|uniref:FtsX-like permease family protein n=1 Tax=Echinicola jeungdonensis TaxID=709343 RepID=A0ABV5J4T3_9BACT|nr:FtsX-like permease family protein [Echinicola jeungdonensis]MDN3668842.1 FtsX-like permease family protein [Echinicola jeungdonensis]